MAGGFQDIELNPGVNSQITFAENQAGVSVSQLIRYKESRIQKLGGWSPYYGQPLSTAPVRAVWPFEGFNELKYVGFGSASILGILSCGIVSDITPQFSRSTGSPLFTATSGSSLILVDDPNSNMSAYGAIRIDTPVSLVSSAVGSSVGLVLSGMYDIADVVSADQYHISASAVSPVSVSSIGSSNAAGFLPLFWTTSGSGVVDVLFPNNNFLSQIGLYYPFGSSFCPTSVGGITIQGGYQINTVLDSTHFQIGANVQSSVTLSSATGVYMNGGKASIYRYVVLGPSQTAAAYGTALYGAGLFGYGVPPIAGAGTKVTAGDWTLDNWSQIYLIACLKDDAIYFWAPTLSLSTAQPMVQGGAPPYSRGAFVAIPQEIVVAWGSSQVTGVQDLLQVRWSDIGSQQGFNMWQATGASFAGGFKIPNGSACRAGMHASLYQVIWTDVDCWMMQYVGQPLVYSFQPAGYGCGALGPHCAGNSSGIIYWASQFNFFMLGPNGVQVLPCTVWDFFFQQLDQTNQQKVCCAVNSLFNEVTWYFPVIGGNGENQAYVKLHIGEGNEYEWDYGFLPRTAWADVTGVSLPLGTDNNQILMQHEVSNDAAGTALGAAFETGYFVIGDATNLSFVDLVMPDAKWSMTGSTTGPGTLLFTFFGADYVGQAERTYGPYAVTQGWPFINTRMRGRYWRCRVESQDLGSFWRVGKIKFRWAPAGHR